MSVNKVQLANGETIIDISDSTVTPETLAEGVTAHDASGQKITGKMVPGGGSSVQSDWNQTDSSAADFIKNKPEIGRNVFYVNPINGVNRIASTGDGPAITHEEMAEMMNDSAKIMMVSYNSVFHYPKMFSVGMSLDGIKFGFIVFDYCTMYKDSSTQKIVYRDKTLRAYTAEIPDEYIST